MASDRVSDERLADLTNLFGEWLAVNGTRDQIGNYNTFYDNRIVPILQATCAPTHSDDEAVDRFATAMKAKLKWEREERNRSGWQRMSAEELTRLLYEHLPKGDPVDVANFCMMLHQNGVTIAQAPQTPGVSEEMVQTAINTYRMKVREYDSDFRFDRPEGFWEEKYGTNLHAVALGEEWAMRKALEAALTRGDA